MTLSKGLRQTFMRHGRKRREDDMQTTESAIEKEIQDKNLNAPRLTPEHIDSVISSTEFHVFKDSCLTVCCITLTNGFTTTGTSACAINKETGEKIAFDNARNNIWELEGYLLKQRLFEAK